MLNNTDKIIKHKAGLLNLAEGLGNVSKACQIMGIRSDTQYPCLSPQLKAPCSRIALPGR